MFLVVPLILYGSVALFPVCNWDNYTWIMFNSSINCMLYIFRLQGHKIKATKDSARLFNLQSFFGKNLLFFLTLHGFRWNLRHLLYSLFLRALLISRSHGQRPMSEAERYQKIVTATVCMALMDLFLPAPCKHLGHSVKGQCKRQCYQIHIQFIEKIWFPLLIVMLTAPNYISEFDI